MLCGRTAAARTTRPTRPPANQLHLPPSHLPTHAARHSLYIPGETFRPSISIPTPTRCTLPRSQALTDIEKMAALLHVPLEVIDRPTAADLTVIVREAPAEMRDVRFREVGFSYAAGGVGNGGPGVRNLSFRIPPGGSVALVGPSGSGKSTCTRLLCRLLEVQAGSVEVCGWDVRDLTQHSLRTCVSCVSQVRRGSRCTDSGRLERLLWL